MECLLETMIRESDDAKQYDDRVTNFYVETSAVVPSTTNDSSNETFLQAAKNDHHEQELPSNGDYQQLAKNSDTDQQNQSNTNVIFSNNKRKNINLLYM